MGVFSRAAKRTVRRTANGALRANDQRLRQRGPTHGYGPNGYGRLGEEHRPKWGVGEYVLLIICVTAGIFLAMFVLALLLRG